MPSLKAIRKRVASVKSTRQITKAMKMVAAAKLRRAQQAIEQTRPYAKKLAEVIADVAARVPVDDHPLLARREPRKVQLLVLTSDRGLCGGFNSNVNRTAERFMSEGSGKYESVSLAVIGRKAAEYFRRRRHTVHHEWKGVFAELSFQKAHEIGKQIVEGYTAHDLDAVYLVYNEFKNAVSQKVVIEPLLPVVPAKADPSGGVEYIYEPGKRDLIDLLLPRYVDVEIWRALLESVASEHGARMTAMDNATKSAGEMIASLTLQFNRARQAAITKELMEIIGGAEALKG